MPDSTQHLHTMMVNHAITAAFAGFLWLLQFVPYWTLTLQVLTTCTGGLLLIYALLWIYIHQYQLQFDVRINALPDSNISTKDRQKILSEAKIVNEKRKVILKLFTSITYIIFILLAICFGLAIWSF